MKVCIVGMGHFAGIVAMCLAEKGHQVMQVDQQPHLIREGQRAASSEPGWVPFTENMDGVPHLVWIAYDVPLNEEGRPAITEVMRRIVHVHGAFPISTPFIVSCQWPVGTTKILEHICTDRTFAYVMENVRVGNAVEDFRDQACIIMGSRNTPADAMLSEVLFDFTEDIMTMSTESAEMAKHATNAFMALQIAFINEIASLAGVMGADSDDVAAALRSDDRVGAFAPLNPGKPFGGGSLKRDLLVLESIAAIKDVNVPIISAINVSNEIKR